MRELTLSELELVSGGNNSTVTEVDDVDVIGHPGGDGDYWGDWGDWGDNGDYGDGVDTGGWSDSGQVSDQTCRTVMNDMERSATNAEEAAIEKLKSQAIPNTTLLLNSIPGGTKFYMPDNGVVTIEELRVLWESSDFKIVTSNPVSNGGVGMAERNDGNPLFTIDIDGNSNSASDGLQGWMASEDNMKLYPLHELAHVTMAGWAHHLGGHSFQQQESYAHALAFAIAAAANQPFAAGYTPSEGVMPGVTTTMGTGSSGSINPYSPCG